MNTRHLEYFIEVANQKSISKAASNLYISQPSLSAAIALLEKDIGITLFHRSQAGVTLTEQGEKILKIAQDVLCSVNQIYDIVKGDYQLTGEISVAAIPAACSSFLVDLITLAQERYPYLSIVINEARPHQIIQQVMKGNVNLGIISFLRKKQTAYTNLFQEKRLVFELLYQDYLCLFVSPKHPFAQKKTVTEVEVNNCPSTCFNKDIYLHQLTNNSEVVKFSEGIFQNITYQFNSLDNIKKVAANNLAVAILPKRMSEQDAFIRDFLVPVAIENRNMEFNMGLIYRNDGLLSIAERKIIELIKEISYEKFS